MRLPLGLFEHELLERFYDVKFREELGTVGLKKEFDCLGWIEVPSNSLGCRRFIGTRIFLK